MVTQAERNRLSALLVLCLYSQVAPCFNVTRRFNNTDIFSNLNADASENCRPSNDSCKLYNGSPVFGHCFPASECCHFCECNTELPIYLHHLKQCAHDDMVIDVTGKTTEFSLRFALTPDHNPDCSERFLPTIDLGNGGEWSFALCRKNKKKKRRRMRRKQRDKKGRDSERSESEGDDEDDTESPKTTEKSKQDASTETTAAPTQEASTGAATEGRTTESQSRETSNATSAVNSVNGRLVEIPSDSEGESKAGYDCKLDQERCEFLEDGIWKTPDSESFKTGPENKTIFSVKNFKLQWKAVPDKRYGGLIMSLGIKCKRKKTNSGGVSANEIDSYLIFKASGTSEVRKTRRRGQQIQGAKTTTSNPDVEIAGNKKEHLDDKLKISILMVVLAIVGALLVVAVCIIVFLVAVKKKSRPLKKSRERRADGPANPTYERGPDSSIRFTCPEESSENGGQTYQPLVENTRQGYPTYATLSRENVVSSNGNYQEPPSSPSKDESSSKDAYDEPESILNSADIPDPDPPYQALNEVRPRPIVHKKLARLCKMVEEADKETGDKEDALYDVLEPEKEGDGPGPRGEEVYV